MGWKTSSSVVRPVAVLAAVLAVEARGQAPTPPRTENAKLEQRAVTGSFAQTVDAWAKGAGRAQWLGYAVPAASDGRQICCGDWHDGACGPCRLEGSDHGGNINLRGDKVRLEGQSNLIILLRAENGRIGKLRTVSEDCTIDAGGLEVTWLRDVEAAESVKYLGKFVAAQEFEERAHDRLSRGALSAVAMTADPSADRLIASFTAPDKPEGLRKEAAFWAGEARGAAGFALLERMAKSDPSTDVRAQVTFALSISRESGAVDEMIRMAHEDASTQVRGQALFWLAQKAGKKAASTITGAIDNDPDTEVKKNAVFALSQMPKDEGVPKLIEVAQNNRNLEVRKQAMFWLGQSNDPRALQFFERVLAK
jgi:HEAT repeat protein